MSYSEQDLKDFGQKIEKITRGESLSKSESYQLFSEVLTNRQPPIHEGALLAALRSKGETVEEIIGCWQAIMGLDTKTVDVQTDLPPVENCGTGMDPIKSFNISTAAAIVAASLGVPMARHGARAITSKSGTVDMAEAMGVDVECPVNIVKKSIERANIGLFNGMSSHVHPRALFRLLSHLRFGTILNIAASLANPASPSRAVRGVFNPEVMDKVVRILPHIGYTDSFIFCGFDSSGRYCIDEVSTIGDTVVIEMHNGEFEKYRFTPDDMGLQKGVYEDIKPRESQNEEVMEFLKVFSVPESSRRIDIICANTAPILLVAGKVQNWKDGVALAREAIEDGFALEQLRMWVKNQNRDPEKGIHKLNDLLNGNLGA